MSEDAITFDCPDEMHFWSQKVFEGEYAIPYYPTTPPRILDIGANCGAFTVWASRMWPGAEVLAYEPAQINYSYLVRNIGMILKCLPVRAAVGTGGRTKLYCGLMNQGEASFFPELKQTEGTYEEPPLLSAKELPLCDLLKVDTEGCERLIIEDYLSTGKRPEWILFEYHSDDDRRYLDTILSNEYLLIGASAVCSHRGVLKYLRRST